MVYFGIPELAYYKEARDVVVRCLHQAALYEDRYGQGPLMAFVRATPEADQYELLPTPLLERVVMYVRNVQEKQRQLTGQTPTEQAAPSIDTTSINIAPDEGGRLRSAYTRELLDFGHDDPFGRSLCATTKIGFVGLDHSTTQNLTFQHVERKAMTRIGLLVESYHTRIWWYELLDLARKLFLNACIVFIGNGSAGQVAAGFFVCAGVLMVNVKMDPFLDPVQNILSLFCHLQLSFSLFVGLLLKVGTVNEQDSEVMLTLVVVCSAAIVIVPVLEVLLYVQELFVVTDEETKIKKKSAVLERWRVLELALPHEVFRLRKSMSKQERATVQNPILGMSASQNKRATREASLKDDASRRSGLRTLGKGLRSLSRSLTLTRSVSTRRPVMDDEFAEQNTIYSVTPTLAEELEMVVETPAVSGPDGSNSAEAL